jgi:cyanophycinase
VDTHLVARGRLPRVLPVLAGRPDVIGLGIEEGCGLTISPEGVCTVVGVGVVCVVDAGDGESSGGDVAELGGVRDATLTFTGLRLHVLADGDRFDLATRRVVR